MLEKIILLLIGAVILWLGFFTIHFIIIILRAHRYIEIQREEHATGYSIERGGLKILIVGDSVMVGSGVNNLENSIAGLIAKDFPLISVKNISSIGLTAHSLRELILKENVRGEKYDIIILEIGPNDIIRFHNMNQMSVDMDEVFRISKLLSRNVIYFSGNVGAVPLWPKFLRMYFESRTCRCMTLISPLIEKYGVQHINVFYPYSEDPLLKNWQLYFSPDRFHPNENGHGLWYKAIKPYLDNILSNKIN